MFDGDFGKWVKRDLFGGKGEVTVQDLMGQRSMPPFAAVLACELAPSGSVGVHRQSEAHEIVMCLAGKGRISIGGEPSAFAPGTVVYMALGQTMALENGSPTEPLRYLIIKAKGS